MDAIVAANTTTTMDDRTVTVPSGLTFYTMPIWADEITNIVFQIDGTLRLSKRHRQFPLRIEGKVRDLFRFNDVDSITFQGSGEIDGQGYMWWVRELLSQNKNERPKMFVVNRGRNLHLTGIRWVNSPQKFIEPVDVDNLYIHDMEIYVDVMGQLEIGKLLLGEHQGWTNGIQGKTLPMFPFNTDGLDPHGKNILIERVNITCFDDAVAIKPCS